MQRDEPLRATKNNSVVRDNSNDAGRLTVNNQRIEVQRASGTRATELGSWGVEDKKLITNSMEYLGKSKSPGKFVIRSSSGLHAEEFSQKRDWEKLKPNGLRPLPKNAKIAGNCLASEKRNKFAKRSGSSGVKGPGRIKSSVDDGRRF